jgi:hypothetical protein
MVGMAAKEVDMPIDGDVGVSRLGTGNLARPTMTFTMSVISV